CLGTHQRVGRELGHGVGPRTLRDALAHPRGVDAGVDDEMCDVDVAGTELARRALRYHAQAGLRAREGRVPEAATQTRRRTGEQGGAAAMRQHDARRLTPRQEAAIARHLPDLAKHALRGLDEREVHVRADVEDADLERRRRVGIAQERGDLLLLPRVERTPDGAPALRLDVGDERRELLAVPSSPEAGESL